VLVVVQHLLIIHIDVIFKGVSARALYVLVGTNNQQIRENVNPAFKSCIYQDRAADLRSVHAGKVDVGPKARQKVELIVVDLVCLLDAARLVPQILVDQGHAVSAMHVQLIHVHAMLCHKVIDVGEELLLSLGCDLGSVREVACQKAQLA